MQCVLANGIVISDTRPIIDRDNSGEFIISFDLAWNNSWYLPDAPPHNHDAAWVFAKYRLNGGDWQHFPVDAVGSAPATATVEVRAGVGALVYRAVAGSGPVAYDDLQLVWTPATRPWSRSNQVEVQVMAIEMVYVPEQAFTLGNQQGASEEKETWAFRDGGNTTAGFTVTSEAALPVGTKPGELDYVAGGSGDNLGPIPAGFPKGYAAFYCMKYELTQGQWVTFFNSLTPAQQTARDITGPSGKATDGLLYRNGVSFTAGEATTTLPRVPMGYLSHYDGLAYLDWAGLRPMTELEYEKASRGPTVPIVSGFAWGSDQVNLTSTYLLQDADTDNETITPATLDLLGNAVHGGDRDDDYPLQTIVATFQSAGPLRAGVFAATLPLLNSRTASGASYYGIMELSGNMAEAAYNVGTPLGRSYGGTHGDGVLTATGEADVTDWPVGAGIGLRGGWYDSDWTFLMTADRTWAADNPTATDNDDPNARLPYVQFRGIRE